MPTRCLPGYALHAIATLGMNLVIGAIYFCCTADRISLSKLAAEGVFGEAGAAQAAAHARDAERFRGRRGTVSAAVAAAGRQDVDGRRAAAALGPPHGGPHRGARRHRIPRKCIPCDMDEALLMFSIMPLDTRNPGPIAVSS